MQQGDTAAMQRKLAAAREQAAINDELRMCLNRAKAMTGGECILVLLHIPACIRTLTRS